MRRLLILACLIPFSVTALAAQDEGAPPGDTSPVLRLHAGGPLSFVTALAFSPDGQTLYVGGHDKTVHVWELRDGTFQYEPHQAFRIPVGPGSQGVINAIAASGDGRWLAVAGRSRSSLVAGFQTGGWIVPKESIDDEVLTDEGLIYVYDTKSRQCRLLRGHEGPVQRLTFSVGGAGDPVLVSVGKQWNDQRKPVFSLRVWDVENERSFAETKELEYNSEEQPRAPSVSAFKTERQFPGVRVVLAQERRQEQSIIHLWEPGKRSAQALDGWSARSLIMSAGNGRTYLAGSHGQIDEWTVSNNGNLNTRSVTNALGQGVICEAGAAISTDGAGGAPQFAAFVATDYNRFAAGEVSYSLWLLDVPSKRLVKSNVPLWTLQQGNFRQPSIAASPRGDFAVAGADDHSIRIFNVQDLRRGQTDPRQKLSALGEIFETVRFVRRKAADEEHIGLSLTSDSQTLFFDPKNHQVTAERGDWVTDERKPAGAWQSSIDPVGDAGRFEVTVTGPNGYKRTVEPKADPRTKVPEIPVSHDVCPPTALCPVPLLALATQRNGEPHLVIYDVEQGSELRWLTGHTGLIHDVHFSQDGRLLATLSEDRTVNVWSLTDLPQHYQLKGFVEDLWLKDHDDGVVLTEPGPGDMKTGTVIKSISFGENQFVPDSPGEFFEFCRMHKPGSTAVLQTSAGDVTLELDQAIDERKPLFTFFLTNLGEQQWSWIGWHPRGPFESSDNAIEQFVGWHHNTGRRDAPVRFTDLAQSRDDYFDQGLLDDLLTLGELPEPEPEDPVEMSFEFLDGESEIISATRSYDDVLEYDYLIDQLNVESGNLFASLAIDNLDARNVESLKLTVNGEETDAVPFELLSSDANLWRADLSQLDWTREKTVIGARLKIANSPLVLDVPNPKTVQYYVPPPTLEPITQIEEPVDRADVAIKARIRDVFYPASVSVIHRYEDQRDERPLQNVQPRQSTIISTDLKLKEGMNRIEMVVKNDLPEQFKSLQGFEQDRVVWHIQYTPSQLPQIRLTDAENQLLESQIQTSEPDFKLLGSITAPAGKTLKKVLLAVTSGNARPKAEDFQELPGLKPDANSFKLDKSIELKLGIQRIHVQAFTDADVVSSASIEVDFRPRFPQLAELYHIGRLLPNVRDSFDEDQSHLIEGLHAQRVDLIGRLSVPEDFSETSPPVTARLMANGKPHEEANVDIDWNTGLVSVKNVAVPVDEATRFQLQFEAGDVKSELSRVSDTVRFLRPPRNLRLEVSESEVNEPRASVRAEFESVSEPQVALKVAGAGVDENSIEAVAEGDSRWSVKAEVPLNPNQERQEIELIVRNQDGAAVVPNPVQTVRYVPAPDNPWDGVRILLDGSSTTDEANYPLSIKVHSGGLNFSQMNLYVNGQKTSLGKHEGPDAFEAERRVPLKQGPENRIYVEVIGEEGRGRKESEILEVTYQPPPVTIVIDSLDLSTGKVIKNTNELREEGHVTFAENIDDAYLTVRGHVKRVPELARNQNVKLWANGFQYDSTAIDERGQFEVAVILGKAENNLLRLELPGLPHDRTQSQTFVLDCENPELKQNLHLLVISKETAPSERESLIERSRQAFFSAPGSGLSSAFQNPPHEQQPLVLVGRDAQRGNIERAFNAILHEILSKQLISRKANRKLVNDVVVVYFRGAEEFDEDGHYLYLTAEEEDKKKRIDIRQSFQENLNKIPGAHLLLLDVLRKEEGQSVQKHRTVDHLGVFRVVWKKNAPKDDSQRLISSIEKALNRSVTLANVDEDIQENYASSSEPNVTYFSSYPKEYVDLRLGKTGGGPGLD